MASTSCKRWLSNSRRLPSSICPGRFTEGERERIGVAGDRQHVVMKDQLDGHQFERFLVEVQRSGVNEFQMVDLGERAPGVLFGGKIQVHDGPVLRQLKPVLAAAHLFELAGGELALLEQQLAHFALG